MYVLLIAVCPFVFFLLAIVLSVLLRYADSDCPFGIFRLFLLESPLKVRRETSALHHWLVFALVY
jgi:hypothetical protein